MQRDYSSRCCFAVAVCALGGGLGSRYRSVKDLERIARQPEIADQVRTLLFHTLGIYDNLNNLWTAYAFMLVGKVGNRSNTQCVNEFGRMRK
jgi:F0F1-type ATP synthase membrane subunit c/vacuolar-type H+-ATPase subunit K